MKSSQLLHSRFTIISLFQGTKINIWEYDPDFVITHWEGSTWTFLKGWVRLNRKRPFLNNILWICYKTKVCMCNLFKLTYQRYAPLGQHGYQKPAMFPVHHTVCGFLAIQELWEWCDLLLDELWIAERFCTSGWVRELPCGRQRARGKILGNECNKWIVFIVRSRTPSQPWSVAPLIP